MTLGMPSREEALSLRETLRWNLDGGGELSD